MAESKTIDLDKILVEEIGQFGKFQLRTLLISTVAVIFSGFHTDYVFTAARIQTRCVIPECETYNHTFRPPWISNAIPEHDGILNNCQRFANLNQTNVNNASCSASLFDRSTLIDCENFVYENQLSVVYEFGLACDEWRRSLIGTIRIFGTLASMPITGYISDHWGRRVALALNAFNTFWIGLSRYWATNYFWFTFLQFAEATFGAGVFSCIHILVSIVEVPGFWLSVMLLPRLGRRPVIIGGFWICSACQFAFIFISSEMYFLSMAVYLVGKCSISAVATALYIYTMELYPTEYRHSLFAYSSMIGRIGTITAPLTPAIGAATFFNFPFVMFGVMSFASGFLVLLTPETLHTKLPDTLEEANNLGQKT